MKTITINFVGRILLCVSDKLKKNIFSILFLISSVATAQTYNWSNVAIGAGGFVSGIITSKTEANLIYARTDVGGAYRWNAATSTWIPLLDWNSDDETTYQGVEALAIDPQIPSRVYMLAGTSYWNGGKTAILRSTDYGNTFAITDVSSQFRAHGNGMGRQTGEKLVVDPNNSNILFCGTRLHGLWKSTNAGVTWAQVWNGAPGTDLNNDNGISFVVFDPSSVSGGITQRIFFGVSRTGTNNNLYVSTNAGTSFSAVTGGASNVNNIQPHRATIASDNNMYITYASDDGPWNANAAGAIWKYNITGGTWTNVTPAGYTSMSFGGISVDPNNASRLIASSVNAWWAQCTGCNSGDRFFLSTNGGASWTDLVGGGGIILDVNGCTWINGHSIHWAGSIEFDPFNTAKAWVTSGNGVFSCANVNAAQTTWKFDVKGLEETVPLDIVSITGGPLVSVIGDYDGFRHTDVTQYSPIHNPQIGTSTGIAFAANLTTKLVRVGTNSNMYYSTNQGVNWTKCTSMNGTRGRVAVSVDGNTILHCPEGSNTTYRSTNNGGSWTSTGVTNVTDAVPVADMVNANKFYIYNSGSGLMRVSTDGGASFGNGGTMASAWNSSKIIRTVPGREGHIWVANGDNGLSRSINSGTSFTSIAGVTYCGAVGLGKAEPSATYHTIYIWGTVGGVRGAFRSIDEGVSWVRVNDDAHEFGGVGGSNGKFVIGDMNVYGRVYMSTVGRGVVYGELSGPAPLTANAGSDVTICQGNSTTLNGSGSGGTAPYTYSWSPVTGLSNPNIYNPVASPATTTTYTLTVTDAVPNTATDNVIVTVTPSTSIPFSENFEGAYPPSNWTDGSGAAPDFSQSTVVECAGGTKGAWVNTRTSGTAGAISEIVTPSLSFVGFASTELSFDFAMRNYDGNPQNNPTGDKYDNFEVLVSVCGGSFNLLSTVTTTAYQQATYSDPVLADCQSRTISLSAYDGMPGVKIMFRVTDNDGNNVYLDNINITGTGGALPVSLINFEGFFDNDKTVKLIWNVTSETDMLGYKILRATDISEKAWEEIGFVSSANLNNNIQAYSFYDFNLPGFFIIYYKLLSVENNGGASESKIIAVVKEKNEPLVLVNPNPSDNSFNVIINDDQEVSHSLQLFNVMGQIIEELNMPAGAHTIAVGEQLPSGIYFLRIRSLTGQKGVKLIKK